MRFVMIENDYGKKQAIVKQWRQSGLSVRQDEKVTEYAFKQNGETDSGK